MPCINPTGFKRGRQTRTWLDQKAAVNLWVAEEQDAWGVAGIQPCQPKTRRHSSWTHILTSLLQTICPADSSWAPTPVQPAEMFFLGGEKPWSSTLPSPITALGTPSIKPRGKMLQAGFPLSWFLPLHQPLSAAQGFWQRKQDQMLPLVSSPKTKGWGHSRLFCLNTEEERKRKGALGSTTQESNSSLAAIKELGNTKV